MSSILTGDRYCSLQELADQTGLSYYFIRQLVLDGKVPYVKSGAKYIVRDGALSDYLMKMEQSGNNNNESN